MVHLTRGSESAMMSLEEQAMPRNINWDADLTCGCKVDLTDSERASLIICRADHAWECNRRYCLGECAASPCEHGLAAAWCPACWDLAMYCPKCNAGQHIQRVLRITHR
jgi:hypothetical protein